MISPSTTYTPRTAEDGNVLFIILMAVVLIGALTVAIQATNRSEGTSIDKETLVIHTSEVQSYAAELERAITYIMQNGVSESDIRFAHPDASSTYGDLTADTDPSDQVFHISGGGAAYRDPPDNINDGSPWEFYGGTHVPGIGTDRADLVAVLPNVTDEFCDRINELNSQTNDPEDDGMGAASGGNPGECIHIGTIGQFGNGEEFYATPNTMDEATFEEDPATSTTRPAPQACVECESDSSKHFYHVIMAR